jgi:hypothetical protein
MSLSTHSFFNLVLSFCRRVDTGVLSLAPLKRVALSARTAPSEPHSQPQYTEPLLVLVEEGLVVAVEVEEIAVPSPPVAAAIMGEERTVTEMDAPQARLEPQGRTGSGDNDVVMVLADQGAPTSANQRPQNCGAGGAGDSSGHDCVDNQRCRGRTNIRLLVHPRYRGHQS